MAQSNRNRGERNARPASQVKRSCRTFRPVDHHKPSPAGKGVRLVIGNGAAKAIDDGLASLIARAIATRNMFLAGRDDSIDAMASRLGVRRDYVAVLVRLS